MTLRHTLTAAVAALPAALSVALFRSRLRDFALDLDAGDLNTQLLARNDD